MKALRSGWLVVRDALRSLRSAPALSAGVVFILTLGIAASVVTFSVVASDCAAALARRRVGISRMQF